MARVSEVLDYFQEPYLVDWKVRVGAKEAKRISEEALNVGTVVDNIIQDEINGDIDHQAIEIKSEQVANCLKGWAYFKKDHPEVVERMVEHKANMQKELVLGDLVGHPDFILGDEVCDLKTSKSISKSHWMQVAQYMLMAYKNDYINPGKKISILRLDKADPNGAYEYKVLEEPFISFWQGKFQARYEAFKEDGEFKEMMRKKLEEERLA